MTTLAELKRQAKANGIRWSDVLDAYRGLRQQQRCEREYDAEIRKIVWRSYQYTPNCLDFYRIGMQRRFPRAFADGDRTLIPGFDVVVDGLKYSFPQFDVDDPAEAVFDYLAREPVRMPDTFTTWREAYELVARGEPVAATTDTPDLPF